LGVALTDYAGTVGGPSRTEIEAPNETPYSKWIFGNDSHPYGTFNTWQEDAFWGCTKRSYLPTAGGSPGPACTSNSARGLNGLVQNAMTAGKVPKIRGVIQRGDWTISGVTLPTGGTVPKYNHVGFMQRMTNAKITDGTSKTLLIGEKWVYAPFHEGGTPGQADDRGWTDGWDFDTMRSTLIRPIPDSTEPRPNGQSTDPLNYVMGSSHSGGINVAFADASVSSIEYDINLETFNQLGNRLDGEVIEGY
jgi:prepilin-type processing-associated H-X9-DG protein